MIEKLTVERFLTARAKVLEKLTVERFLTARAKGLIMLNVLKSNHS